MGATDAPKGKTETAFGGFHLCELTPTATRVGLSNRCELADNQTASGVRHRSSFLAINNFSFEAENPVNRPCVRRDTRTI